MEAYEPQTAKGHEEPFAVQFSIFLPNRIGQLRDFLALFAGKELQVLGLSVVDATDWAVIRIVFSDPNKAREILKSRELPFAESQVLLIALRDDNALINICELLLRAEINIHFAFPLAKQFNDQPVMVLHVEDPVVARQMLIKHGLVLLGDEDLAEPT